MTNRNQASAPIEKTYFTSDLHFYHNNVVQLCERPTTKEEHSEWLIKQLNSTIPDDADVYHLGDFAFVKDVSKLRVILNRLKGRWLFVLGNHDNESALREAVRGTKHVVLGYYKELRLDQRKVVLCHFPIAEWNSKHHGSLHFHGHSHGRLKNVIANRIDVGIDTHAKHIAYTFKDVIEALDDANRRVAWEYENTKRDFIEKIHDINRSLSYDDFKEEVGDVFDAIFNYARERT